MKLIDFSVKHSLFVNLLSVFVIIAGTVSIFELRREAFPDISFDKVSISTIYKGASAEEVEKLVTTKIEREVREVDDIESIYSSSLEGVSLINLEISLDAKDKKKVINDIQKAVDRVTDLPEGVDDRPVVTEITSGKIPVIKVALSGKLEEFELRDYADALKDRFEDINGVASVARSGWRDEEFWVEPDAGKMAEYYVSIEEIMDSLAKRNVAIPGGKLRDNNQEYMIRVMGEFTTKEEIENVVIRANDQGNWLKVKDVARVKHTFEEEKITERVMGTRAITLTVIKREKGDAIKIVDKVNKTIDEFKKSSPGELKISTFYDMSYYIKRRLNVLKFNGTIGLLLIIGILFLFLEPIPALMTFLGIPIAMFTTLYAMNLMGMSINLITMFGLVVVLGIVVDDGIIISENVYRYLEQGLSPNQAAIKGASEVAAPVISTVLTTIAAFSPLLFMTGLLGKFIRNIPFVIIIALTASLMEAFIILPSHLADFAKPLKKGSIDDKEKAHWLVVLREKYRKLLKTALENRYKVASGIVALFFVCILLVKHVIPFVLFGSGGVEQFQLRAEAKKGTSLERMSELMIPVEEFISKIPKEYMDTYETIIGEASEERGFDPEAKTGSNVAGMTIYLTPSQQRKKTADQIMDEYRPALEVLEEQIPELEKLYFREQKEGPPVGKSIDIRVRGEDFSIINQIVTKIKNFMGTVDGVQDINDSYDLGSQELQIEVDKEKASAAYLNIGRIASSVRSAIEGGLATTIKRSKAEDEIKVLVRLPKKQRDTLNVFESLLIPNQLGNLIPLKEVAHINEHIGLRSIGHLDGKRFVSVTGGVDLKKITSAKANALIKKEFKDIAKEYPGYTVKYAGEEEETQKSMLSLLSAFAIAVLLIFLILATQFNSLVQPMIVLLTIPFGMIGVVLAFLLHGMNFSFLAILGIVGLTGIVVNDSIVLVDFINRMRRDGASRQESIIEAGVIRMRPVLITTFTTVAGLSTVAYGIGGSDPFLKPMALAIAWGLTFATILTLIVMPCFYAIVDDIALKVVKHGTVFERFNGNYKNKHSLKTK
ncbi:MAG: efflux RND transporter permease subunit [Candidatus Omnitrophota bacterium]